MSSDTSATRYLAYADRFGWTPAQVDAAPLDLLGDFLGGDGDDT